MAGEAAAVAPGPAAAAAAAAAAVSGLEPVSAKARALLESLGYSAALAAADRAAAGAAGARRAPEGAAAVAGAERGAAAPEREAGFALDGLAITELPVDAALAAEGVRARFRVERGGAAWLVDSRVVFADGGAQLQLKAADREAVAAIAVRFAPPGSTVHLQADAHGAGNVFVGMIMCFAHTRIPTNLVSGDNGCGIAEFPVLEKARRGDGQGEPCAAPPPRHARVRTGEGADAYHAWVVATTRRVLLRGRAAENGAFLATNLLKATAFYGFDEIASWLREMRFVLDAVGAKFASYEADELSKARALLEQGGAEGGGPPQGGAASREALLPPFGGLSYEESVVLRYISRFAQSLGSSGNIS